MKSEYPQDNKETFGLPHEVIERSRALHQKDPETSLATHRDQVLRQIKKRRNSPRRIVLWVSTVAACVVLAISFWPEAPSENDWIAEAPEDALWEEMLNREESIYAWMHEEYPSYDLGWQEVELEAWEIDQLFTNWSHELTENEIFELQKQ
jgi:predicted PurR-regulated permease PerM